MRAGVLKDTIVIFRQASERNSAGEEVVSYERAETIRAQVKRTAQSRTQQNEETIFPARKTFIVRLYHQIPELSRVEHEGKMYRILSIDDDRDFQQKVIDTELIQD